METTSKASAYFDSRFRHRQTGFSGAGNDAIEVDTAWVNDLRSASLTLASRLAHRDGLAEFVSFLLDQACIYILLTSSAYDVD
jgi:hypothetical protein